MSKGNRTTLLWILGFNVLSVLSTSIGYIEDVYVSIRLSEGQKDSVYQTAVFFLNPFTKVHETEDRICKSRGGKNILRDKKEI